ncbi:MAG: Na+/H+ antiporter NhaA [Pseudomonadota bacterium]
MKAWWDSLLQHPSGGGIVLFLAAVAAMVVDNSFLSPLYDLFKSLQLGIRVGDLIIDKPLILWVNDGLMAVFFFHVGLEIKHEMREGNLADPKQLLLPAAAAVGGMVVPAAIYLALNTGDPLLLKGWAIPAATDIAFALGILTLLGRRVPLQLKVFLLALAIIDDIGAIAIIAVFYTTALSFTALEVAATLLALLLVMNLLGVRKVALYLLVGIALWVAVLKSGVHATLAGVLLAFFIPTKLPDGRRPVHELEHGLKGYVAFLVMPIFAFANAGVSLDNLTFETLSGSLPLGIILGLVVGKQLGVFAATALVVGSGLAKLPPGVGWAQVYGVACLAGVGFTMSLFIGGLAFTEANVLATDPILAETALSVANGLVDQVRYGVLTASVIAGLMGFLVLLLAPRKRDVATPG